MRIVQEWNARELIAEISGRVVSGMDAACRFAVDQAQAKVPVWTGRMSRNIDYEIDVHGLTVEGRIGGRKGKGGAFYELFVEMGTRKQAAQPHLRPAVFNNAATIVKLIAGGNVDLTQAFYDRMSEDGTLAALVATYHEEPAVFTMDPAPGDAALPYVVSAGEVAQRAFDTKNTRGRETWRDVRCYAPADGDPGTVEAIAERVRALFHRHALAVEGAQVWVAEAGGPVAADEDDAYGRIVTIRLVLLED